MLKQNHNQSFWLFRINDRERRADMNMPTPYVIETNDLSKTYKKIQALQPLDLKVQQNSIFGFPWQSLCCWSFPWHCSWECSRNTLTPADRVNAPGGRGAPRAAGPARRGSGSPGRSAPRASSASVRRTHGAPRPRRRPGPTGPACCRAEDPERPRTPAPARTPPPPAARCQVPQLAVRRCG